jgi:hypothetical protein
MKDNNKQIKKYSGMSAIEKSKHAFKHHPKLLSKIFMNMLSRNDLIKPLEELLTKFSNNPDNVINWWWQEMEEEAKKQNAKYDVKTISLWREHYNQNSQLITIIDVDYTKFKSLAEIKNHISDKLIPFLKNKLTLADNTISQQENAANNLREEMKEKISEQNRINGKSPKRKNIDAKTIIYEFCKDKQKNPKFKYNGKLNASAVYKALREDALNPSPEYNHNPSLSRKIVEKEVRKFNLETK